MLKRLAPKTRLSIVGIHVVFVAGWLGSSFVLLMLSFVSILSFDVKVQLAIPDIMHLIDLIVIIPAAVGIIVTGVLLSVLTPWGLTRYRWIVTKELTTVFLAVLGAIWLNPLVFRAMDMTASGGASALRSPAYYDIHTAILWTSIVVLPLLIGMVIISKLKPWGRVRQRS